MIKRTRSLEETISIVTSLSKEIGLTRLVDITGLDNIGIPVYASVRPNAKLLQSNSGKGLTHKHAQCSALMEALEFYQAESIEDKETLMESEKKLRGTNTKIWSYNQLPCNISRFYNSNNMIKWITFEDLLENSLVLCPADTTYFEENSFCATNTNGLASGNNYEEALLHGILEVIERHCYSNIIESNNIISNTIPQKIDWKTLPFLNALNLCERIKNSGSEIYIMKLKSNLPVYCFWAVIIDKYSPQLVGAFNVGLGCDTSFENALIRAITEAAQSRLVYIHGNREDIRHKATFRAKDGVPVNIINFFDGLPSINASELQLENEIRSHEVETILKEVKESLKSNGHQSILSHVLRKKKDELSVVKVIIPSMKCETRLL